MAKKKDKKDKDKPAGRGDAVRSAVDQAFQATAEQAETARTRAQEMVEEFAQAATRVRDALEDLRPAGHDEIASLRTTLERLEKRVAALETAQGKPKAPARRATTRSAAAKKKPAAAKTKPADRGTQSRSGAS